jgi:L-lactate dehydrogenase complex protein LldF
MSLAALRARIRAAVADPALARPYENATARGRARREQSIARMPDWAEQRASATAIRHEAVERLDELGAAFERNFAAAGGCTWHAADATEACRIVVTILQEHGARSAIKAKSMATEEVHLNAALQRCGIDAIETDLGEFIVQLAGQTPSHITAPAIHLTRQQIGRLFADKLGVAYTDDPVELTAIARRALRQRFLGADAGISGANLLIAETGELVLLENEANIRMCLTLPRLHVAVAGIEKVIARRADLGPLLAVLPRSATGQEMGTYVSVVGGAGPPERHVVLLDGGRRRIHADPVRREILACIRCGACLNACPVYERIGGYAYGSVYPGPIGSLLGPHGIGIDAAAGAALPFASSLCGACRDVCPVGIDLPELLREGRERYVRGSGGVARGHTDGDGVGGRDTSGAQAPAAGAGRLEVLGWSAWAFVLSRPRLFHFVAGAGRAILRRATGSGGGTRAAGGSGNARPRSRLAAALVGGWTLGRSLPTPARRSFLKEWERRERAAGTRRPAA